MEKFGTPKAPIFTHLELTRHCNLSCFYCTIRDNVSKSTPNLPVKHFKKILDQLVKSEVFDVSFFGGEPFLYPHIYNLAMYAREKGLRVGFLSNGTLIKEKDLNRIKELFDIGTIALNGLECVHDRLVGNPGMFRRTVHTIKELLGCDFPVAIDVLVSASSVDFFPNFMRWVAENLPKINAIFINCFVPYGDLPSQEQLSTTQRDLLFEVMDQHNKNEPLMNKIRLGTPIPFCLIPGKFAYLRKNCSAGWLSAAIDPLGDIRICPWSPDVLGNILVSDFKQIWSNSEEIKQFRSMKWLPQRSCKKCAFLSSCFGGCKVISSDPGHLAAKQWKPFVVSATIEKSFGEKNTTNQEISPATKYLLDPSLIIRKEEKGSIIYLKRQGSCYWCNDVALRILQSMNDGLGFEEIVKTMITLYETESAKIRNGVTQTVILLEQIGAVQRVISRAS